MLEDLQATVTYYSEIYLSWVEFSKQITALDTSLNDSIGDFYNGQFRQIT